MRDTATACCVLRDDFREALGNSKNFRLASYLLCVRYLWSERVYNYCLLIHYSSCAACLTLHIAEWP